MTCDKCKDIIDRPEQVHCIRTCDGCGRKMLVHEPGDHGLGMRIRPGDVPVVPVALLKMAFNPLHSRGTLAQAGLGWFAEMLIVDQLTQKRDSVEDALAQYTESFSQTVQGAKCLTGLDLDNAENHREAFERLGKDKNTREWWAMLAGTFYDVAKDSMVSGDARTGVWAMGCAERCRMMVLFKDELEEVVYMGHSAKRLVDVLHRWDTNKTNDDEGFWQATFKENSYVLSQVFSAPVVLVKEQAYVGGMNIDRHDAKLVDYLMAMEQSRNALLVEIKTPVTPLLGGKYSNIYGPSAALSQAVVQALDYRRTAFGKLKELAHDAGHDVEVFNPRCVLIVGNGVELSEPIKRKSFELFRESLKDVEIVTYDELFKKMDALATLFNLTHHSPVEPPGFQESEAKRP